jgi:hypothetical protein
VTGLPEVVELSRSARNGACHVVNYSTCNLRPTEPAKDAAVDIPAARLAGSRCRLARFARLARYAVATTSTKFSHRAA